MSMTKETKKFFQPDEETNMFEKAVRMRLRFFSFTIGDLSVEDLWKLPIIDSYEENLNNLLDIHKRAVKEYEGSTVLRVKILKYIIKVKTKEAEDVGHRRKFLIESILDKKRKRLEKFTILQLEETLKNYPLS